MAHAFCRLAPNTSRADATQPSGCCNTTPNKYNVILSCRMRPMHQFQPSGAALALGLPARACSLAIGHRLAAD